MAEHKTDLVLAIHGTVHVEVEVDYEFVDCCSETCPHYEEDYSGNGKVSCKLLAKRLKMRTKNSEDEGKTKLPLRLPQCLAGKEPPKKKPKKLLKKK